MNKICYIIDTESVQNRWGHLMRMITPYDEIIAFFGPNCHPMTTNFINALLHSGAHIELISRVQDSHNQSAVNFQLVTELGYRIAANPERPYILISENPEYDPLIEYWTRQEINLTRYNILTSKPEDITMSYNHRVTDTLRTEALEKQGITLGTQTGTIPQQTIQLQEPDAIPTEDIDDIADTLPEPEPDKIPITNKPEPVYLPEKACKQEYHVRLNKLHVPANRSKIIAGLLIQSMRKPANQRILFLYNSMSAEFGKKSPFTKAYYKSVKALAEEISVNGPFPETESSDK